MKSVLKPKKLIPGDCIGIVAPAGSANKSKIYKGIKIIEDRGYKVVLANNIFIKRGYFAGNDIQRANGLDSLLRDNKINAIFCARGGFGSIRLIDNLKYNDYKNKPKILVGYSDITTLQLALWYKLRLISFYGPLVETDFYDISTFTSDSLWNIIEGKYMKGSVLDRKTAWKILKPGNCSGPLLGGCLSLIHPLIGTSFNINYKNSILFIEDVNEDPSHIDRSLSHLKLSGILGSIKGLVVGKMKGCIARKKPSLTIEQILTDYLNEINGPVVLGVDFGHIKNKITIPLGCNVELNTRKQEICLLENPVN